MSEIRSKLLVALDGSERAMKTIDYLCRFTPFRTRDMTLFSVLIPVPESYYDMNKEPFSRQAVSRVKAWESGRRKEIEEFMDTARIRLQASGLEPEQIQISLANRQKGIARDIMAEAGRGYEALVMRRRGMAASLLPLVLGGVATKVVDKLDTLPLILAGAEGPGPALCLAVDGSEGAQRAADFAATMVGGTDCRVVLCSVLRPFDPGRALGRGDETCAGMLEAALDDAGAVFIRNGLPENRMTKTVVRGGESRAQSIVETARANGCTTLVLGRKGLSRVDDFDLGRVPKKVIWGARELSVWLVP